MIKTKRILRGVLIVLIIMLLIVATTSIFAFHVKKKKPSNKKPEAYDFTGFNRENFDSVYNANSTFLIKDATAFKNFCSTTSEYQTWLWDGTGYPGGIAYNYKDKTVKLEADIDLSGYDGTKQIGVGSSPYICYYYNAINVFNGVFDGQGYTISNYYSSYHAFNTALFGTINGTVKNTQFYNFGSYSAGIADGAGTVYTGTIANSLSSGAVIDSCIVDTCSFGSGRSRGDYYCGGIAGSNSGTIKNCIVKGSYTLKADDGFIGISACGIDAYPFVASGTNATNSIFMASYSKKGADNSETGYSTEVGSGNYLTYEEAKGKLTNCSKVCGKIENYPDYQWFEYEADFIPNYSFQFPLTNVTITIYMPVYLRAFVKFEMISFTAGDGGSVSHANVWVPEDYSEVIIDDDNGEATVYNITVAATPDEYHEFDCWDGYKATFVRCYIDITFLTISVNGTNFSPISSSGVLPNRINYDGEAKVEYKGIVNNKVEYVVEFKSETITVYYEISKIYTVAKNKNGITKTSELITVDPQIILKTYGVIWL